MKTEIIESGSSLYEAALALRYEAFFKEFDLPKSVTADELEVESLHIAIQRDGNLLAYGRLSPLGGACYRISQIVVRPNWRRRAYGSRIVTELMRCAAARGAAEIVLNSQVAVMPLYERLGFREVGERYKVEQTGVEHQKMVYRLDDQQNGQ